MAGNFAVNRTIAAKFALGHSLLQERDLGPDRRGEVVPGGASGVHWKERLPPVIEVPGREAQRNSPARRIANGFDPLLKLSNRDGFPHLCRYHPALA